MKKTKAGKHKDEMSTTGNIPQKKFSEGGENARAFEKR